MKLGEWREKERVTVELPSGLSMTIRRRVTLTDLAARGSIPAPLVGLVDEFIAGGANVSISNASDFAKYGEVLGLVVKAAAIDPPVADAGDEGHVGLDELPLEDKIFVFNLVHQEADKLAPFRPQPLAALGAAPGGEGILAEAEQHPGG